MTRETNRTDEVCPRRISRRRFIKLSAAVGLLAGCRPAREQISTPALRPSAPLGTSAEGTPTVEESAVAPTATPTSAPTSTPTSAPTATPTLTPMPTASVRLPDVIKFYPDVPSKAVHTHHAGVWDGDELVPGALRQMLDASITELTGLDDAREAWTALFDPDERVAIKVNTMWSGVVWTHVPLAMAAAECLQEVGVPAEQIVIFDRSTVELAYAGFTINKDGPGVRCYGTAEDPNRKGDYTAGWKLLDHDIQLSDILLQCNALINIPFLRAHDGAGISFGMKNHYGTFDRPSAFHRTLGVAIAELNALPPITDRTRLIIGDMLAVNTVPRSSYPWATPDVIGDAILMSFDPVAHDTIGLHTLSEMAQTSGEPLPQWVEAKADPWLQNGAGLGLGTNDPDNINFVEVNLG